MSICSDSSLVRCTFKLKKRKEETAPLSKADTDQLSFSLGLITGGTIADNLSWRWSQYIVAIIDGVVLILLFLSFEETLFPRFLFTSSGNPVHNAAAQKPDSESKDSHTIASVSNHYGFPRRKLVERLRLWVYYPEDRTTYWQYFRRPFFLLSFPNVIIVSTLRPSRNSALTQWALGCIHLRIWLHGWHRVLQHHLRNTHLSAI